jgi:hypothetical protein
MDIRRDWLWMGSVAAGRDGVIVGKNKGRGFSGVEGYNRVEDVNRRGGV